MDAWSRGDAYEPFMGRWSRLVAPRFLTWLDRPAGLRWLDVGCGTGALTGAVLERCAPQVVIGVDPAFGFVRHAAQGLAERPVAFGVGDAGSLPCSTSSLDVAVSGLALNFVPDPGAALAEMRRVTRPAGVVAFYVWDYPGQMQVLRHFWDAAAELDPLAARAHEGERFGFCRPDALEALAVGSGLRDVEVRDVVVPTDFTGFDDYWLPFLGGQGPAPSYLASLDEARRTALRETLRSRLPFTPDGALPLSARAWAVRGTR